MDEKQGDSEVERITLHNLLSSKTVDSSPLVGEFIDGIRRGMVPINDDQAITNIIDFLRILKEEKDVRIEPILNTLPMEFRSVIEKRLQGSSDSMNCA